MPETPSPVDPEIVLKMNAIENLMRQKGMAVERGGVLSPEEVEAEMKRLREEGSNA